MKNIYMSTVDLFDKVFITIEIKVALIHFSWSKVPLTAA